MKVRLIYANGSEQTMDIESTDIPVALHLKHTVGNVLYLRTFRRHGYFKDEDGKLVPGYKQTGTDET